MDENLIPGQTYKYAVAGVNAVGEGYNSNEMSTIFGTALPSNITSNTTLSGAYYSNGTTISNNSTLTIISGVKLGFASGKSLTVENGSKLIANGATFTSTGSQSAGAWYGLVINGSADIDNCTIEYANRGIYFKQGSSGIVNNCTITDCNYGVLIYKSKPYIKYNSFKDCSRGVYVSNNKDISGDTEIDDNHFTNCNTGIYCQQSSPMILDNHLMDGITGVSCYLYSSPTGGFFQRKGNNIIENHSCGLQASYGSNPNFGLSWMFPGYNSFNNNTVNVNAYNQCYVKAENNWWGEVTPSASKFVVYNHGSTIDYTPWLSSDPNTMQMQQSGLPLSKNSSDGDISTSSQSDSDQLSPLTREVMEARLLAWHGEVIESQKICKTIITNYPDSSAAIFALETLWMSSSLETAKEGQDLKVFKSYVKKLSKSKKKNDLRGHASIICGKEIENNITKNMDAVYNDYKKTYIGEMALYFKFHHVFFVQEDKISAKSILEQMYIVYPQSELTEMADRELYPKGSNKEFRLRKESKDIVEIPTEFSISQNYPNPFNPTTHIQLDLPEGVDVKLEVFNIRGQKVATLVDGYREAGSYEVFFDGRRLASGVYFYRVSTPKFTGVKRMLLVK